MGKKISIITPSLNQGEFIEDNIKSVLNQNYADVQHIIIDGGSHDKTVDIIKQYESKINYWISEIDTGQSHAINKGLKIATGEIINWLNADDFYEGHTLSKVDALFKDEKTCVVAGKSRILNSAGETQISTGTDIYISDLEKTIGWARIDQPETFFRNEAFQKVGPLNEKLHYIMDREWWMRYLYIYGLEGINITNDIWVNFRLHDRSKSMAGHDKFQVEHDTLFYLMAGAAGLSIIQSLIKVHCKPDLNLTSEIQNWQNHALIKKSVNYYLLKRADEFYYRNNVDAAREFLSRVNSSFLGAEDKKLFNTLKFRVRLPVSLINIFRKKKGQ